LTEGWMEASCENPIVLLLMYEKLSAMHESSTLTCFSGIMLQV